MSSTLTEPEARSPAAHGGGGLRAVAVVLLACWIGATAATVLAGHRESTFARLEADVAAGHVTEVQVTEGLGPGGRGYAQVQVRWRDGFVQHSTTVIEARPRHLAPQDDRDGVTAVIGGGGAARALRELDPDVRITDARRSEGPTWYGWTPPLPVVWTVFAAWSVTVWLLAWAPRPRRATRWGWFWWVLLVPPIGSIAFLLLSGLISSRQPPPDEPRTSGGVSFVLALLTGLAVGAVVRATG